MSLANRPRRPGLPFIALVVFLGILWFAGGASRADVMGQAVVRATATALLVFAAFTFERPSLGRAWPVAALLASAAALAVLQLLPLPPPLWQSLPGRKPFIEAAAIAGIAQPWRPISLAPGFTLNALASLLVPATTLLFLTAIVGPDKRRVPAVLLGLVGAAAVLGLAQVSSTGIDNPLINEVKGQVSGPLANRNHFALLMSLGCIIVPIWAFSNEGSVFWRVPVGVGLILFFMLMILASGSRAGMLTGAIALITALLGLPHAHAHFRRRSPSRGRLAASAVPIVLVVGLAATVLTGRAASIDRFFNVDLGQDMRTRGFSTVWSMIETYFPLGSGIGGFEVLFRKHEPFALLQLTYFNHAHNDFLETALDAGLFGILLLLAGLAWWVLASWRAWRIRSADAAIYGRAGSAMVMLIVIASVFDYPARTPIIMAMLVIASVWLSGAWDEGPEPALPLRTQSL